MAVDLVCKMDVNEKASKPSLVFEGNTYYFCSEGCLAEFKRRPQDYLPIVAETESCCDAAQAEKEENGNV